MAVIRCFSRLLLVVLLTGVTAHLVTGSTPDDVTADGDFQQQQHLVFSPHQHYQQQQQQQQQQHISELVRMCKESLTYEPTLKHVRTPARELSLGSLISCYFLTTNLLPETEFSAAAGSSDAAAAEDESPTSDSPSYTDGDTGTGTEQKQEQEIVIDDVSKRAASVPVKNPSLPAAVGFPNYRHIGLRTDFGKRQAASESAPKRDRGHQASHYGFRMDFGKRRAPPSSASWSTTPERVSRGHHGYRLDFGKRRAPSSPSAAARNFAVSPSARQHLGFRTDFGKRRAPPSQALIRTMGMGLRSRIRVAIRQPQHFGFRTDFGKRSEDAASMQQMLEYLQQ